MKIEKVRNVKTPSRGHSNDAGIDFYLPKGVERMIPPRSEVLIPSGIVAEVPKGHALIAFNKSSISTLKKLIVGACVIDEGYRGEIHIHLINTSDFPQKLSDEMKLTQFILIPVNYDTIEVVDNISASTDRGEGGFGSTGN